jgi:hypothetical protein
LTPSEELARTVANLLLAEPEASPVAARDAPVEILRELHDAIASSGTPPRGPARRAVLGEGDRAC